MQLTPAAGLPSAVCDTIMSENTSACCALALGCERSRPLSPAGEGRELTGMDGGDVGWCCFLRPRHQLSNTKHYIRERLSACALHEFDALTKRIALCHAGKKVELKTRSGENCVLEKY